MLDLKKRYGIGNWCAYGYGRDAYKLKDQRDIHYNPFIMDEFLHLDAENEEVDEKYLIAKEKEYGHPNLWQEFINDRFTSIDWPRQFYPVFKPTLNHHQIKQQFQLRIKKIEEMLDKAKPDFVFFIDAGAMGVNLLYYLARKRGIPTPVLTFTRFSDLTGFTNNLFGIFNNVEKLFEKIRSGQHISPKRKEAIELINNFRNKPKKSEYITSDVWNKSKQDPIRKLVLFSKNFIRKCIDLFDKSFPRVYDYSPLDFIRHNLIFWFNSQVHTKFDQPDYSEDYAFLALNSEPEITLLMQAPSFSDQAWVVRKVAESLPVNLKLYVKDHPTMTGYRNPKFYEEIRKFPNIKLIDTKTDSIELIKNSKLVFTISGSAGFEALLFKKPSIIFGSVGYRLISLVRKCKTPEDLPYIVKDALENHRHDEEELIDFVSALLEDSFRVDATKMIIEKDIEKVKKNPDITKIADELMKYLKNYEEHPNNT